MERKVVGIVVLDILENNEEVFKKFESAYRFALKNYVEPTTIGFNPDDLSFEQRGNQLIVHFKYTQMSLHYEFDGQKGSSSQYYVDFGRGLFEYLAKFVVVSFLEDELEVRSEYTQITCTGVASRKKKTI